MYIPHKVVNVLRRSSKVMLTCFVLVGVLYLSGNSQTKSKLDEPAALFLTWQHDPTTSMTIDWHTTPVDTSSESEFHYRKVGDDNWKVVNTYGYIHGLSFSDRLIHRVELRGLQPGTAYRFRFGEDSKAYIFETMPSDLNQPLKFAAGGDVFGLEGDFQRMNRIVMEYNPAFIIWGGDLAYANADPIRTERWYEFFDVIKQTLIHDDGRVVPIIVAIGNHELFSTQRLIWGRWPHHEHTKDEAEAYVEKYNLWDGKPTWFFDLFAFPGKPSYNVLDFGDYMSLLVLDSNHYSPVAGGQTGWLKGTLAERRNRPHLFPIYHVPAFPSADPFDGTTSKQIREHWIPLFEEYGVRVAFENHGHTYKRTYPIRNEEKDSEGVVYLGDGAWGIHNLRELTQKDSWYIDKASSENHAIIVTLEGEEQNYSVINIDGKVIDSYTSKVPTRVE